MATVNPPINVGRENVQGSIVHKWWTSVTGKYHEALIPLVEHVRMVGSDLRRELNLRYARMYGNIEILGLSAAQYTLPATFLSFDTRVTFNIIEMCVDTAAAKLSKNKPKPYFLTEGGNPALQRQAKNLTKFTGGQFYGMDLYNKVSQPTFIDSGVFGTGLSKTYHNGRKIITERVIPDEILIDDAEAYHGDPRNLYQQKPVSRDILIENYGKDEEVRKAIENLPRVDATTAIIHQAGTDMVWVFEAWHLPSSDTARDGRHVIFIKGADLFSEEFTWNRFPFSKLVWNHKIAGWWGKGMAEILTGCQIEINRMLRQIQMSHYLLSTPMVLREVGSHIVKTHLNNEIGRIVDYQGTPPQVVVFQTTHPEVYQHLERLVNYAFQSVGISQLSAGSQKPPGLNSGKALREYNDIETERFMLQGQRWEEYHLDIAELQIMTARELAKVNPDYSVKVNNKKFIQTIKWKNVDMDENKYMMQAFPVSQLSSTPAGKLQDVTELTQAGFLDPDTGLELLDFPDLEQYKSLRFAKRELVRDSLEEILEADTPDGVNFTAPEPTWDLQYAIQYSTMLYARCQINKEDEWRMEFIRRFTEQAQNLIDQAKAVMAPPPAPMPGTALNAGQGTPLPPPQAELAPQV